jgi:CHAT domain-containing protein
MRRNGTVSRLGLATAGLALGAWAACLRGTDVLSRDDLARVRAELVEAVGPVRFSEGRLTGGFAYAPFQGHRQPVKVSAGLTKVVGRIARDTSHTSFCQPDAAIVKLLAGKPRQAIECLERAVSVQPSGRLLTDLSAAYLELAADSGNPYFTFKALASADRALATPNPPAEALFNRALALDKLSLQTQATHAWQTYRAHDPSSPWAAEAAERAVSLKRPWHQQLWRLNQPELLQAARACDLEAIRSLVRRFPQAARLYGEEQLLGEWAVDARAGRTGDADSALSAARCIGTALGEVIGDFMLADSVGAIDSCEQCEKLERGHVEFSKALALYRDRRFEAARSPLASATASLARFASPIALRAEFNLAVCDYQRSDYPAASVRLASLERRARAGRYPNLSAEAEWLGGLIAGVQGRLTDSLTAFKAALNYYAASGDQEKLGAVYDRLAQNYALLGDENSAWMCRLKGLAALPAMTDPLRHLFVLDELSQAASDGGEPLTAVAFVDEEVALAHTVARSEALSLALLRRAAIMGDLNLLDRAKSDLETARKQADLVPDSGLRKTLSTELLAVTGERELSTNPRAAVGLLTLALAAYQGASYHLGLSHVFLHRSLAWEELGREVAAEADLESSLEALERQGKNLDSLDLRSLFFDQGRRLFDTAVRFYSRRRRAVESLAFAERARAQCLLAMTRRFRLPTAQTSNTRAGLTDALPVATIQARLAPDVVLLEYAVLPDRLVAWSITRTQVRLAVTALTEADLIELVDRLMGGIQQPARGDFATASARAFDLLVRPFIDDLRGKATAIVVPDKCLYRVPFAALVDRSSASPWVATHALEVAPSATAYLSLLETAGRLPLPKEPMVLVLGTPLAGIRQAHLAALPAAFDETLQVASLYPQSRVLAGKLATRQSFVAAAPEANLVHVAAHAAIKDDSVGEAGLIFADAQDSDRPLRPEELMLGRTSLVFFSACRTAAGTLSASEGPLSPARFFLSAGVPTVVASLWDVDDRGAEKVALLFHRRLRAGAGVLAALREAETALWRRGEPMSVWAAFEVFGAASR